MNTPIERRQLVATEGMMRLNASDSQYAKATLDGRWLFLDNFAISVTAKTDAVSGYQSIFHCGSAASDLIGLTFDDDSDGVYFNLYKSGSLIKNELIPLNTPITNTHRFTISRSSGVISIYDNNRLIYTYSYSTALSFVGLDLTIGSGYAISQFLNGCVSQFIAFNGKGMTASEVEDWHYSNIPPPSCRPYAVAWYRMNNVFDGKLIDSIEELNCYKQVAIVDNDITSGEWTFLANGASVTLTYGNDSDGNYVQFVPDPAGASSYTYKNASSASRIRTYYKWSLKIKRMAGTGSFSFETNGASTASVSYNAAATPIGVLTELVLHALSDAGSTNQSAILSGASGGAEFGVDYYRIYSLEISSVLTANHGSLENFSNDELGVTHPLLKSTDVGFYNNEIANNNHVKFNGIDEYAQVNGYAPNFTSGWTIQIKVKCGLISESCRFFSTYSPSDSASEYIVIQWNTDSSFRIYVGDGLHIGAGYDTYLTVTIVSDGTNHNVYYGNSFSTPFATIVTTFPVTHFYKLFFGQNGGGAFNDYAIVGAFKLWDRQLSVNDLQRAFIGDLLGSELDLNFSSVFLNSGTYYVNDRSGNARHATFYNFDSNTEAILVDQDAKLPDRKALKFNGSNQYISIANFTPTSEKGYTMIIGVRKSNSVASAYTGILSKRSGGNVKAIVYNRDTTNIAYYKINAPFSNVLETPVVEFNNNVYVAITESNSATIPGQRLYTNGYNISGLTFADLDLGWDDMSGSTNIGLDNGQYLDGHIYHTSIFKGIMTPAEIFDVIVLNKPPERLWSDCQLWLNYEEIIDDSGTYRIKDWSPQGRTSDIQLNNFSADEVDPGHVDYRLIELSTLI